LTEGGKFTKSERKRIYEGDFYFTKVDNNVNEKTINNAAVEKRRL